MAPDAVAWLEGLFADLQVRAPHGITWSIDRSEPPLELRVKLADAAAADLVLRDDGPLARIAVAEQSQQLIDADWDVGVPPCPDHGAGLRPVRAASAVHWRCPHGDVDCPVGEYAELLWPPRRGDEGLAGALLAQRIRRRGVNGMSSYGVSATAVRAQVHEGSDEAVLRELVAPLALEISWIPPVGWARRRDGDGESLSITNVAILIARLEGPLGRSPSGGLVVGDCPVTLRFEHGVGEPGSALLADAAGVAFANAGDHVICGGEFSPGSRVRGAPMIFMVGRITRPGPATDERPATPRKPPSQPAGRFP